MVRDFARFGRGMTRGRLLAALLVVLAIAGGLGAALRPTGDGVRKAFANDLAGVLASNEDPALPGRVEYAARRGPDGLADLYRDVRRSTDATRAALQQLRAPEGYGRDLARLTQLLEQQSDALRRLVAATTSQDRDALAGATRELARTAAQASDLRSRIQLRLAGAKTS